MNSAIKSMLNKFEIKNTEDTINALREILQQIALLGLWRGKFFEHAAFYGGTALRILYGLDRFSEDIDFSLLSSEKNFPLGKYINYIERELQSYGFNIEVKMIEKKIKSPIFSGVLKTNTRQMLLVIKSENNIVKSLPHNQVLKIKIEVDVSPATGFSTEIKYLLLPIPFSVRVYSLPDLFAGKMHAILCRNWKNRVKGRDWYDIVWYITHHPELNLKYLEAKMRQTSHLKQDENFDPNQFYLRLTESIESLDISQAKEDVINFIKNRDALSIWSKDFFINIIKKIILIK